MLFWWIREPTFAGCLVHCNCLIELNIMFKDIFLFLSCFPLSSFSPVVSLFSLHLHLVYICLFLTALPHREFFLSVSCPLSHVKTLSLWGPLAPALSLLPSSVLLFSFLISNCLPLHLPLPSLCPSISICKFLFLTLGLLTLCVPLYLCLSLPLSLDILLSLHVWPLFSPSCSLLLTWLLLLCMVCLSPIFHCLPQFSSLQTQPLPLNYAHIFNLFSEMGGVLFGRWPMMLSLACFFNWSIVDLQCCVNFCCTAKWYSYTYI